MKFPDIPLAAKKGDSGKVIVIGGSPDMHGAPILAALGALAAGVDLVRLFLPQKHAGVARSKHLNLIVEEFSRDRFSHSDAENIAKKAAVWADAVVLGCGFTEIDFPATVTFLQSFTGAIVLDAGALFAPILPLIKGRKNVLLTPHGGEFIRLFGAKDSAANVQKSAKQSGLTILKKGQIDLIASPSAFLENKTGCPQMTVGGTGDALAGISTGLLARKMSPFTAAYLAAEKWGIAGQELASKQRVISAEEMLVHFAH